MRILYYNLQLGSYDGSNSHATGMLAALKRACGEGNVMVANRPSPVSYNHSTGTLKAKLGRSLDPFRRLRKSIQSRKTAGDIVDRVKASGFEPDLLLARATLYDTAPIEVAKALGCKLVTESNTPFEYECCDLKKVSLRKLVRSFECELYSASDGVYAVSSTLKSMLVEDCGVPADKVKVVPNGYSADLYSDFDRRDSVKARVRSELKAEEAFVITFIGSLQTWHGIDRLVEIADLMGGGAGRRVVFWVLGDGPKRDAVKARADGSDDFFWFGNVAPECMKELLYASDLGIMPYDPIDRFYFSPLKMYDMIGAGLPYVGLRIGQIIEETPESLRSLLLNSDVGAAAYVDMVRNIVADGLDVAGHGITEIRPTCSWDARAAELVAWMEGLL